MNFAGLVKRGKNGSTYTGGISTAYAAVNNSWLVMWNKDILRVLDTREEAEHYATQLTTEGVVPLHPRREEKERRLRAKKEVVVDYDDDLRPGFEEKVQKENIESKKNWLKFGRRLFAPGDSVMHADRDATPWVGLVRTFEYREYDIDGTGWYYEVGWWDVELNQFHEGYLHQDFLRPL